MFVWRWAWYNRGDDREMIGRPRKDASAEGAVFVAGRGRGGKRTGKNMRHCMTCATARRSTFRGWPAVCGGPSTCVACDKESLKPRAMLDGTHQQIKQADQAHRQAKKQSEQLGQCGCRSANFPSHVLRCACAWACPADKTKTRQQHDASKHRFELEACVACRRCHSVWCTSPPPHPV